MNFQSVIANVPDYKAFLTVDEMDENCRKLANEFPTSSQFLKLENHDKGIRYYV